jgi:small subunit ribosomal protein S10
MAEQKARINLASTDIGQLNQICTNIIEIAKKTKGKISGPIPLPTKRLKHTTRRSPCGNGKASFENFEMRIHKRMIDLGLNERALRLVMRVPIPERVQIQINMLE